jgi:hypothetical protein
VIDCGAAEAAAGELAEAPKAKVQQSRRRMSSGSVSSNLKLPDKDSNLGQAD